MAKKKKEIKLRSAKVHILRHVLYCQPRKICVILNGGNDGF